MRKRSPDTAELRHCDNPHTTPMKSLRHLMWFTFLLTRIALASDGIFSGKNLGGFAINGEDGLPLPKALGRVEMLWRTNVFASGVFVKDGFFALGSVGPSGTGQYQPPITVRCWNSAAGASFEEAVIAGHGFGAVTLNVPLSTGGVPPVDLTAAGFKGMTLVAADPVPYWVRIEETLTVGDSPPTIPVELVRHGQIAAGAFVTSYRIEAKSPVSISANLYSLNTLNPVIRLFDSTGAELTRSDTVVGSGPTRASTSTKYLHWALPAPGTYHLGISAKANGSYSFVTNTGIVPGSPFGEFDLSVSQGIHGVVQSPSRLEFGLAPTNRPIDLIRADRLGGEIVPKTSWVLIHGWNTISTNAALQSFVTNLTRLRPADQIFLLDWSDMATSFWDDPFSPAGAIRPVAEWAAMALLQSGLRGTNLNLIGHSFGAYIADEIAQRIPGGVNSIVALDPAANVAPNQFDPLDHDEVNFRRDAKASWAIHASASGSDQTPVTATEAFILETGANTASVDPGIFLVLQDLLSEARTRVFAIERLLDGGHGPFADDQYTSYFAYDGATPGYEGILRQLGTHWDLFANYFVPPPNLFVDWNNGDPVLVAPKGSWAPGYFCIAFSFDLKTWSITNNMSLTFQYPEQRIPIPSDLTKAGRLFLSVWR